MIQIFVYLYMKSRFKNKILTGNFRKELKIQMNIFILTIKNF